VTARVVITGMGCISGLGQGMAATWAGLVDGVGAIRPLDRRFGGDDRFAMRGPAAVVESVDGGALEARLGRRVMGQLDPVAAYAVLATEEALGQAGLLDQPALLADAAILYGAASGGNVTVEEAYGRLFLKGQASVHPLTIPKMMGSAAVAQLSILFGVRGPTFAIASACASSAHAVGEALDRIRAGRSRIVIAGGADASLTYGSWMAWKALRAMAPDACRPFSEGRQGMVLGEGAATLVLEALDHARARGAPILAEVIGAGASSDAFDLTQPDGAGALAALALAYQDAGITRDQPALVSAHGTGTPLNDKTEAQALRACFGDALPRHRVIATKSAHGHLLGAGGAIELAAGVAALRAGLAPQVLNYLGADLECDLPLALGDPAPFDGEILVSNSFAFGGLNAVLIARRMD
jgi:nodulation protein E